MDYYQPIYVKLMLSKIIQQTLLYLTIKAILMIVLGNVQI